MHTDVGLALSYLSPAILPRDIHLRVADCIESSFPTPYILDGVRVTMGEQLYSACDVVRVAARLLLSAGKWGLTARSLVQVNTVGRQVN